MRMAGTVIDPAVVASLAQSATGDEKLAAAQIANAQLENTASIVSDLDTGYTTYRNDGDPTGYVRTGGRTYKTGPSHYGSTLYDDYAYPGNKVSRSSPVLEQVLTKDLESGALRQYN